MNTIEIELPFEIRTSSIDGLGAFAKKDISVGDFIGFYDGDTLTDEEAWLRTQLDPSLQTTMFSLGNGYMIDGSRNNCGTFRINHGCDPNVFCKFHDFGSGAGSVRWICFYACKSIRKGEELLYDYFLEVPKGEELTKYRCYCGSAKCFGTMSCNPAIRAVASRLHLV